MSTIYIRYQLHPRAPVLDTAFATAGLVYPVRLVEVGAVRSAGEQGAFADELELTPGQQRVARHVVLCSEGRVAREPGSKRSSTG
jgi:hypothetical protein